MTPVQALAKLFGSRSALARAAGVDPAMVTRWEKPVDWKGDGHVGSGGRVPTRHNRAIMSSAGHMIAHEPAQTRQDFIGRVAAQLDPAVCPTCGQPVDDGRVL